MSSRSMKSLVKFAAAASVISAAALTASTLPAAASTTYAVLYGSGNPNNGPYNQEIPCTPPTTHPVQSALLSGIYAIQNFCGGRMWLHQYSNGSGWSYCVSPHGYADPPGWAQFPAQLLISENTAAC
jgi:hypothetical protein